VLEDWERCAVTGAQSVVLVSPDHVTLKLQTPRYHKEYSTVLKV